MSSAAFAASSPARAVSTAARELSSAIGEMKCCAARLSLEASVRSAWLSKARADSRFARRSATRLASSARSIRPSGWPALTRLPSATSSASSVPAARVRTIAVCGATSGPENSTTEGMRARVGVTTSALVNSSAGAALSPAFATAVPLPGPSQPANHAPPEPATSSSATPPISHFFFIRSPSR